MDCNKEEAIKAMEIAEKKLQNSDFTGALKLALKAQQLFPGSENIPKLLAVCEVLSSAQNKLGGAVNNWYAILQIEQMADVSTIKKQFKKFALLLHPDKNKFAGAEAAFKLIGDANRVLSEQATRTSYDIIYRTQFNIVVPKPPCVRSNGNSYKYASTDNPLNTSSQYSSRYTSQQPQCMFSTRCPSCNTNYQHYRRFQNEKIPCYNCCKTFVAYDLQESLQKQNPNHKTAPCYLYSKVSLHSNAGNQSGSAVGDKFSGPDAVSKISSASNLSGASKVAAKVHGRRFARAAVPKATKVEKKDSGEGLMGVRKQGGVVCKSGSKGLKTSTYAKRNRGRMFSVESDESCDSWDYKGTEDAITRENAADTHLRRSSRKKQNITYKDNLSDGDGDDDDFVNPPKRSTVGEDGKGKASRTGRLSKDELSIDSSADRYKEVRQNFSIGLAESSLNRSNINSETEDSINEAASSFECITVPDPDFSNFEKDKEVSCFDVDQIWATYDTVDGMPRFYVRIKKVLSPGFKLQISWLEANPKNKSEIDWCNAELPVACGKYIIGSTEITTQQGMFSHQMHCTQISSWGYLVYPRKGETWALYQNWDIRWSSNPTKHTSFKLEFVEILSDFNENSGIGVAYLGKVEGFVSVFCRTEQHGVMSSQVPPNEAYRFSHRIPSYKLTGKEREGVPEGSFELDAASLPHDFFESGKGGNVKTDDSGSLDISNKQWPNTKESEGETVEKVTGAERIPAATKAEFCKGETSVPTSSPRKPAPITIICLD